jgi:hypothetical protein
MDMLNQQSIEARRWKWILGPAIILGLALSFLIPPAAPVFGIALLAGGIYAYRRNTDKAIRSLAVVTIAIGAIIVVGSALFLWLVLPTHYSVSGVLTTQ